MKILFVTSECAPYSKSGGLADVAFSLPPALQKKENDVAIITPYYKCVRDRFVDELKEVMKTEVTLGERDLDCRILKGELSGVPVWFIDNEELFDRDRLYGYDDDKLRFAWFSKAVIEVMEKLDFIPDILHCNDWETALAVIYLKDDQARRSEYRNVRTVYTIHNIAYQGQFGRNELTDTFDLAPGWYEGALAYEYEGRQDVNLMKGAMLMADAVSTVSPTYARELHTPEFGKGLEAVCDMVESKMYGILNGIDPDHYDPGKDQRIPHRFTIRNKSGKELCKAYLQETFGLRKEKKWPLFVVVARLVEQKGVELIRGLLDEMMRKGVQLIIFGQGDKKYTDYFYGCIDRYPGQFGFSDKYNEEMAARVFAGADFYLMPSAFEPCGLSQMMAMRYGTVPIVHETGGLKDTVRAYSDFDGIGDGFSFVQYNSKALMLAIDAAIKVYFAEHEVFETIKDRCMKKDFSWDKSAQTYLKMYSDICGSGTDPNVTFADAYEILGVVYGDLEESRNAYLAQQEEDYLNICQVRIEGPGEGTFYVKFTKEGMEMQPYDYQDAHVKIATTFDNLYDMAVGKVSADKLFVNGQLKVEGNISKGAELRYLLGNDHYE
ncbi:MAG: glycogen/starch synthase [Erysipelotrichaceae bacterium]|nr:glycogen/starch synthase [Erysipelotrichaceae bacterium]